MATAAAIGDLPREMAVKYDVLEEIGTGAFSTVRLAVLKDSGKKYAVKIIDLTRLAAKDKPKIMREADICRELRHPNIVLLEETFIDAKKFMMVFELMEGGELFEDIVRRAFYSERDASHLMRQILSALQDMHSRDIAHRDLKPENLLLETKEPGSLIKITDFGLAVRAAAPEWYGFAGTPGYLAPEVLNRGPYGKPVDIWATGIILYILLAGYPPFWDDDQNELFRQIKSGRFDYPSPDWDDVSDEAKDLIEKMIVVDPSRRLTATEALSHPWVALPERVARMHHRQATIEELKKFNARQKFKGAVRALFAAGKMSQLMGGLGKKAGDISAQVLAAAKEAAAQDGIAAAAAAVVPQGPVDKHAPVSESTMMESGNEAVLLQLTHRLLACIEAGDWDAYTAMCDPSLTCFEPEACGEHIAGLDFHKFYFDNRSAVPAVHKSNLSDAHVRFVGTSSAIVTYSRLVQSMNGSKRFNETRVFEHHAEKNEWLLVHFHRS